MSQTTSFADLRNSAHDTSQIRKILEGVLFLAPENAPVIETLTGTDGSLQPLPEDYWPVGLVSSDGYTFTADVSTDETESHGYANPTREDIVRAVQGINFTVQETFKKNVLSLAYGMSLDAVTQATNGEIVFDRPSLPEKQFYRAIVIGKDGAVGSEYLRAKHFPRVYSTEIPEEAWGTEALAFDISLRVDLDRTVGTPERNFIAGPGALADASKLGFKSL